MPKKLNIGITCYPSIGGSGILASALGEKLALKGHDVHFISYERPIRLPHLDNNLFFHPVKISDYGLFKYPDYTLPLSVKMAEVAQSASLDILHVHYAVPHATAAVLAKQMIAQASLPKVVTTLHGTDTTLLGQDPSYGPAIRYALERSDAVTAVSHFLASETRRIIGTTKPIDVIHNFFEPKKALKTREEIRTSLGLKDEVLLCHASNLRPLKRIDRLLNLIAGLNTQTPFKLLILAGGDFSTHKAQVDRLKLNNKVIVLDNVASIEDYLNASDMGLFTSDSESFCLGILEAMCFGAPSVSTQVGGIPEVIEEGKTGLMCDPENLPGLIEAAARLIDNKALRQTMGKEAKKRASELFSSDTAVAAYEAVYNRVLS